MSVQTLIDLVAKHNIPTTTENFKVGGTSYMDQKPIIDHGAVYTTDDHGRRGIQVVFTVDYPDQGPFSGRRAESVVTVFQRYSNNENLITSAVNCGHDLFINGELDRSDLEMFDAFFSGTPIVIRNQFDPTKIDRVCTFKA